ncbi:MAG: hypothetical protein JW910_19650 [Anaerolineae bacterium]|nr:hypothetical protein [Anaerolineae bacterium]
MREVYPHEYFRLDFDEMIQEAKRQDEMLAANRGELALAQSFHDYFAIEVVPRILANDWVFDAASRFASEYALDCFQYLKLSRVPYELQENLVALKGRIEDFVVHAAVAGNISVPDFELPKASDFLQWIPLDRIPPGMRGQAKKLEKEAQEHEDLQLRATLKGITECYITVLPRILYVVRCALKVEKGLSPSPGDSEISDVSEDLSWYEAHIDTQHPLFPILGSDLRDFYRIVRNVGSHPTGIRWLPNTNQVVLKDKRDTVTESVHVFQQKYRYLVVYFCDYGMRAILAAFCERDRGSLANWLAEEYHKTFPDRWQRYKEIGTIRLY